MANFGTLFRASASCLALAAVTTSVNAQEYLTQPGDTLSTIAQRQLGDGARWQELCTLNQLADCNIVQVGQVIRLGTEEPAATAAETAAPAETVADAPAAVADAPAAAPQAEMSANILPNPELSGAVVGVMTQDGALPTGWNLSTSGDSDLVMTVVESGPASVTLSLQQTKAEGWAQIDLSPRGSERLAATADQEFRVTAKIEVLSGTLDGAARLQLGLMHYQPDGERLRPDLYFSTALPLAETASGFEGSVTTTAAETGSAGLFLRVLFDAPFEGVLRISDLELVSQLTAN